MCDNSIQEEWLSPKERASVSAISVRHILASPGYTPGTMAVNVTWMKRGFNACQTHRSMYPSIFNRFPVIQPISSKVHHFSPWDNRGKCYMDRKRIQCCSNAQQHIPIYLQLFTSYSEILVGNCNFFLLPCIGVFPLEFRKKSLVLRKTRIMGLPGSEDSLMSMIG